MKKIMLAVCLMFGGATLVAAQDQTPTQSQTQTTQDQDQDRQQISVSELPEGVTAKLESQDYSGWTVGNAYKKMDDSQNEIYIVEMKQGTETKKVKFDRDGNLIEKHDKSHKDKADNTNYRDDSGETESSTEDESATDDDTQSETQTDQADNSSLEKDQQ